MKTLSSMEPVTQRLDEVQIMVQQTRSELEFYDFEVRFFYNLLDKYLAPLIDKASITRVQATVEQLKSLEEQKEEFRRVFDMFRECLDETLCDLTGDKQQINQMLQDMLQKKMDLFRAFRRFKKVFFALFEYLLHSEKADALLYE
ncbi:hypothetical protein [Desertivirga arenae]|uniref:hypothetical protein n=1 Tax=Desertivirga arenae TaxID=2810309 RepID=UPI001A9663E9|nr:hypothetical protein [Pedobacter sp. SYSU D00823]